MNVCNNVALYIDHKMPCVLHNHTIPTYQLSSGLIGRLPWLSWKYIHIYIGSYLYLTAIIGHFLSAYLSY